MCIGAAVLGRFPLRLPPNLDRVEDFGKLLRWIGGVTGVEDGGVDGVGREMPLREKRYRCYAPVTWRILCEVS